ncbi:phosphotriesterase [Halopenitus sp. H-Gu1]|uniref:phosphotriesterase family protein n=1 Tax=Halopenitus sp. H-Gu1 TaxID=3242697 RepID=UPI00359DF22F
MPIDSGSIVTVTGRIDPASLGVTMCHEHLFIDTVDALYTEPDSAVDRRLAREPVSMETLPYVRRNAMQHRDNMRLDSVDEAIDEVSQYVRAGGDAIVDVTPKNVGEDPRAVREIAYETGVTIVHGTAHYVRPVHPERIDRMSVDEIADEFVDDVEEGIGETDVRAGLIGEIGLSGRIHEAERKVARGAARAALRTGASVNFHPPGRTEHSQRDRTYPTSRWCLEVLDIVEAEGLSPDRVVMSHMDRTVFEDLTYQRRLADRGAYLEYDLWGMEATLDQYGDAYMSDSQRLSFVTGLIEDGYADRLLFSHDVYTKLQRTAYGGFGYGHVLEHVVPLLKKRGVEPDVIDQILIENPRTMLTFADSE